MILRDYQSEAMTCAIEALRESLSTLLLLPTGCGKTVVFSHAAHQLQNETGLRTLILAHREELIWQAAKKIESITGDRPEIEMGEYHAQRHSLLTASSCVISTIQTLNSGQGCTSCFAKDPDNDEAPFDPPEPGTCPDCIDGVTRRMMKFDPTEFGLIVTDEAHHSTASTYRRVYNFFKKHNPQIMHLGVTATADRADESALGKVFDSVAYQMDILDGIDGGWLVPITQQWVQVASIDLSGVKTTAGDLNERQLEEIMLEEETLHGIVNPTLELSGDRPTLVFTTTVRHAELVSDILNRHRSGQAICIHGTTPRDDRRRLLAEYAQGKYQYLVGCGVFLEGFDEPRISCVAMARPTKSRPLYAQAIGRGTRPIVPPLEPTPAERRQGIDNSTKRDLLVLDFVGNSGQHKLISTADILGGKYDDEVVEAAVLKAKAKGGQQNLIDTFEETKQEIDQNRRRVKAQQVRYQLATIDPFDAFDVTPGREPAYHRGRVPTEKQLAALQKMGVDTKHVDTFWKAKKLLDGAGQRRDQGLCTLKQIRLLGKFSIDARDFSFEAAKGVIDQIAGNRWQIPAGLLERISVRSAPAGASSPAASRQGAVV